MISVLDFRHLVVSGPIERRSRQNQDGCVYEQRKAQGDSGIHRSEPDRLQASLVLEHFYCRWRVGLPHLWAFPIKKTPLYSSFGLLSNSENALRREIFL